MHEGVGRCRFVTCEGDGDVLRGHEEANGFLERMRKGT